MSDHVLSPEVNAYEKLVEQPDEVSITIADDIFIKHYRIKKAGTYLPQHSHKYDHGTLVCHGSVRVWVDGRFKGVFHAPSAINIPAGTKHIFEVLEDNTTLACIHNASRSGEIEVLEEHQIV